jgi:hypothetical protein
MCLFHHIMDDNTSLKLLTAEIIGCLAGNQDTLPPPVSYRNFIAQLCQGPSNADHEAFFETMLHDLEAPTIAFGDNDIYGDERHVVKSKTEIDQVLRDRLKSSARLLGVSAASLFHLAWAHVLTRLSGNDDVVFGTVLSGRMWGGENVDRTLGLFINTLPIRVSLKGSAKTCVRATHKNLASLLAHEQAPLSLAQRCSAVPPSLPLFNTLLNYRRHVATPELDAHTLVGVHGMEVIFSAEETNYPVALFVDERDDGFTVEAHSRKPIQPGIICRLMIEALIEIARALETDDTRPLTNTSVGRRKTDSLELPTRGGSDPKLDRRKADHQNCQSSGFAANPTLAERAIIKSISDVWSLLLECEPPVSSQNFFDGGGNSILAVRAAASLSSNGLPINVKDVFTTPTLGALAALLAARMTERQIADFQTGRPETADDR